MTEAERAQDFFRRKKRTIERMASTTGLVKRKWFASAAAASTPKRQLEAAPTAVLYPTGLLKTGPVWYFACWGPNEFGAVTNQMPTPLIVTGRSMRHIDRLARDFLAHGVTPTWKGERGVGKIPPRIRYMTSGLRGGVYYAGPPYYEEDGGEQSDYGTMMMRSIARSRFTSAEDRAARVVWR
jgi:hypothetical protein